MKRIARKITAMFLVVSMVTSMVGIIPAAAASNAWQIATGNNGYAYYNVDQTTGTTNEGLDDASDATYGSYNSVSEDGACVEVFKTISDTGVENQFNIELKVVTTQSIDDLGLSPDAAVVLVFDNSMSMGWDADGNILYVPDSNGEYQVEGTISFVASAKGETAHWIKLSTAAEMSNYEYSYTMTTTSTSGYGPNANTTTSYTYYGFSEAGWTVSANNNSTYYNIETGSSSYFKPDADVSGSGNYGNWTLVDSARMIEAQAAADEFIADFATSDYDCSRMVSVVKFAKTATQVIGWTDVTTTAGLNSVTNAIDGMLTASEGGTNIQDGLTKANALVNSSDIDTIYVVLLTDGAPTVSGTTGGDSDSNDAETYTSAHTIANTIDSKATIYTVAFAEGDNATSYNNLSISNWLKNYIASDPSLHVDAAAGGELSIGFTDIMSYIARLASAWLVTDPMGQYINLVVEDEDATADYEKYAIDGSDHVSVKDNILSWDLKSDYVVPQDGKYTYELNYKIQLDTDAEGFQEGTYYLTNGQTTLDYFFLTVKNNETPDYSDVETQEINFLVPAVQGEYPEYTYIVRHFLQTGTEEVDGVLKNTYVQEGNDIVSSAQKYDTITNVNAKFQYETNASDGRTRAVNRTSSAMYGAENTNQQFKLPVTLTVNGQYLDFFYDLLPTTATVYHYYYDGVQTNTGIEYTLSETKTEYEALVYIDDQYTATANPGQGYTQEKGEASSVTIDLVAQDVVDGAETQNIIEFHYYKDQIDDQRDDVSVNVVHEYTTYNYVLGSDGRYEYDNGTTTYEYEPTATYKYGQSATATKIENGFTYTGIETTGGDLNKETLTVSNLTDDMTTITLSYEKYADNPNALVDVTVTHIYETVNTIVNPDGTTGTNTVSGTWVEEIEGQYRVGETFTATEEPYYNGNTYTQYDVSPAMEIAVSATEENTITIKYTRNYDDRDAADITVYHSYTYYEELIDEDSGKASWVATIETGYLEDMNQGSNSQTQWYINQYFTATAVNEYAQGLSSKYYNMITDVDDLTIQLAQGENAIYIDYELYGQQLEDASVTVTHTYYTWTYDWSEGVYGYTISQAQYGDNVNYTGDRGERYTAEEVTDFDSHEDWERFDTNDLTITLSNLEQTIDLVYIRKVVDTTQAGVTVNHHYTTTTATVVDGQVTSVTNTETVSGELMTALDDGTILMGGMSFTAQEVANGFTPSASNVLDLVLADGMDNEINLYYSLSESDLVATTVQVIHNYTTYTTNLVGDQAVTTSSTESVAETLVTGKYVGQYFTATADPNGFSQVTDVADYTDVVLVAGENIININYEKSNNYTQKAVLDVTHIYTTAYTNGQEDDVAYEYDPQIGSWATVTKTFTPDTYTDLYEITNISGSNDTLNQEDYTIVLEAGENTVTIEYYRLVENRTSLNVTVNHYYTSYDAYTQLYATDGATTESYTVWLEDGTFTASLIEEYLENTYAFQGSGEDCTITLNTEDALVIDLGYLRTVDTTPETPTTPSRPSRPTTPSTDDDDDDDDTVVEIPEEDTPLSETPDTDPEDVVEIPEEDTPLSEEPVVEIPVEEVPLSDVPQTGDDRNLSLMMTTALLSAVGLAYLIKQELDEKKKQAKT